MDNPFYAIKNEAEKEKMKKDPNYKPEISEETQALMLHLSATDKGELMEYGKYKNGMTGNPLMEMHQEYNEAYSN